MYAGHAALALYAKARRQRLPLLLLVVVAYAPDWIEWLFQAARPGHGSAAFVSHSIVSVLVGSTIVAALALIAHRPRADAVALWLLYVSHWLADFVTGLKPTWPGGPTVGLHLYDHPWWDFAIEAVVVAAAWIAYRRSLPPSPRRRLAVLIPAGLLAFQVGFLVVMRTIH